jgi:parvulin-like peptidyl-prolyl isomerase
MTLPRFRFAATAAVGAFAATLAFAQAPKALAPMSPDTVLADNGIARITRADYDLELTRLPPDVRGGFATSEKRVVDLINRLLVTRTLAIQADQARLLEEPETARRVAAEMERLKAQLMQMKWERDAEAAFEANIASFEARARELFAIDPTKYGSPAEVAASHIMFMVPRHPQDEATRLVEAARKDILAGADFGKVAAERSEDPAAKDSQGQLGYFKRGQSEAAFEQAAFAMTKVGEISGPVVTSLGVHLIRLDGRREGRAATFEQAKPRIMADLRKGYVDGQKDAAMEKVRIDAFKGTDMAKVDAMVIQSDPAQLDRIQREALQRMRAAPPAAPK